MKYAEKKLIFEAVQLVEGADIPLWLQEAFEEGIVQGRFSTQVIIETENGAMRANPGDYIVNSPTGRIYPVEKSDFEAIYEEVK